jgi:hypothetical protein
LTFYPPEKLAPPFIRVEKKFFKIGRKGYQKKRNFFADLKEVQKSSIKKKGKNSLQKNWI